LENEKYSQFLNRAVVVEYGELTPQGKYQYQKGTLLEINSDFVVLQVGDIKMLLKDYKKVREEVRR